MNHLRESTAIPSTERNGARIKRMMQKIQNLQSQKPCEIKEISRPATEWDPIPKTETEYTFLLPSTRQREPWMRQDEVHLHVIRDLATDRFKKPKTRYFIYRREEKDETDDNGTVVDTWRISSRFSLVVQPRFLGPDRISVEEAESTHESKNLHFQEIMGLFGESMAKEKYGIDYAAPAVEATKHFKATTLEQQEALLQQMITIG